MPEPGVQRPLNPHYETTDVPAGLIVRIGLGLLAGLVIAIIVLAIFFRLASEQPAPRWTAPSPLPAEPPAPRLQVSPVQDLQRLRALEDAVLYSYGWIDREAGIARIPIERAMEILVQQQGTAETKP